MSFNDKENEPSFPQCCSIRIVDMMGSHVKAIKHVICITKCPSRPRQNDRTFGGFCKPLAANDLCRWQSIDRVDDAQVDD